MALVDKNGNRVPQGALMQWIETLPEPQKAQYETLRQEGIAAGYETDGFKRIMREFIETNGLTPIEN